MARNPWGRAARNVSGPEQTQRPANAHARQSDVAAPGQQAVQCHAILENIADGFIALDWDCRCTYANKAAAAFLNTTTEQLIGRPIWDVLPAARYQKLQEGIARAADQRVFVKFEEYCEQCGRWFEWHCCPNEDSLAIFIVDASERKEAEEQVVRSEQHYHLLFETMPQGVVYQDADGKITAMNPAAERILGRTPEEFLGRTSVDEEYHTLRDDGTPFPGLEHPSMVALRTGQAVQNVVMGVFNPRDRAYRWINITAVPLVRPGEDKPYQVYTHFSDITELRQAERALRHSERRFRKLFEADLTGIFITKPDGTFLDCNEAMAKMLGYGSREELLQHHSTELYVDPAFREEAVRILQTEGIYLGKEGRVWRKDGSIAHLLGAAVLLKDEETGEPYIQGVAVDITERRHTEEALRESEQRYRKLFEANLAGVYITKLDGTIVDFNTAMMKMLGYDSRAELLQKRSTDLYADPEFRKELVRLIQEKGVVVGKEALLQRKDGSVLYAHGAAALLRDERTGELSIQGVVVDITERKRAEEALRESEARYRKLFEANMAGVYLAKLDGTILDFNDAMMKMLGYDSRTEVFQHRVMDFYVDPEQRLELIRELRKDGVIQGREVLLRKKDGTLLYALGSAVLLTDGRTGEPYIQGAALDVTERKKAEDRLARNLRDLEVLSVSATHFLEAMPSQELFQYTAQQLQAVAGRAVIAVTEYRTDTNQTIVRAVVGPKDKLRKVSLLLRRDPAGMAFTVAEGTRQRMTRGRLEHVTGGLHDLTFYQMPLPLCLLIERVLHVGKIYAMPFYLGDDLMGTVAVATDRAEGLQNRELMEAIVNQAALALKRTQAEEALREWNATLESRVAQRTEELEHRTRQLQRMTLEVSQAEDRERRRMAEILHDDLQQIIAGAKFHLNLLRNQVKSDGYLQALGGQIDQMLKDAIEKSRGLSHELSPVVLHKSDFAETLGWLAGQMWAKHGLIVHVHADGAADLQSDAIKSFLYRTAQELLFNIIKHARVNEAGIRLRRRGPYICLSVSDRGRGFDPQELREAAGFGLLSIRERVELLGGRMKIKSAPGRGSTFFIVVPDRETADAQTPPLGQTQDVGAPVQMDQRRLRVLLADDHRIVRDGLRLLLGGERDIEVVGEAVHGREAVDLALRLEPDVVIMDVAMPLIDGDEATRQIKKRLPKIRVVALSAYNEPGIIEKMYRAGAEGYVLKTASSEELLAAIRGTGTDTVLYAS